MSIERDNWVEDTWDKNEGLGFWKFIKLAIFIILITYIGDWDTKWEKVNWDTSLVTSNAKIKDIQDKLRDLKLKYNNDCFWLKWLEPENELGCTQVNWKIIDSLGELSNEIDKQIIFFQENLTRINKQIKI